MDTPNRHPFSDFLAAMSARIERRVMGPPVPPPADARRLYVLPGPPRVVVYQRADGSRQVRVT